MSNEKKLSYGEKAVGLDFNPSKDSKVDELKLLYAKIIDILNDLPTEKDPSEKLRWCKIAITNAQTAQMWAVKAITYKLDE